MRGRRSDRVLSPYTVNRAYDGQRFDGFGPVERV